LIKAHKVREELEGISETLYEHGKRQIAYFLELEVIKDFDTSLKIHRNTTKVVRISMVILKIL
jgi:hypothetical protein